MLATGKTKLGLHINQKSSTDKCRTTFTYLVIFGKWTETSQLSNTGYERQASVLDLKDCITAITSVQSESSVVQTVYQQLCQLIRGFYSPLFAVFWPQTDTGRTFHFPHTSCHSSGTTSRGENIYQPPGASSQDRQTDVASGWLAGFHYKYSPFTYLPN